MSYVPYVLAKSNELPTTGDIYGLCEKRTSLDTATYLETKVGTLKALQYLHCNRSL